MNLRSVIISLLLLVSGVSVAQEQLTELPTVYIETENRVPITSKEDYVAGTVTVVSANEAEACTDLEMEIRGRGNSTWGKDKKPYRMKLAKKKNFLNMPSTQKNWVFLANYADKTLLRNSVAFELSRFLGLEYTTPTKFVDVVLNGEYIGNYLVTDQMEVKDAKPSKGDAGRIPAGEQEEDSLKLPEDISGGYLVEVDGFADGEPVWFRTPKGMKITVKYPKDDVIVQRQKDYITQHFNKFEAALFSDTYTDPTTGWRAWADEKSVVNWYIACEMTGNSDAFWSTYIYKKAGDDHLIFGPLWDFDIAFCNDNRLGDATRTLMRDAGHSRQLWIRRLWTDPGFRTALAQRWKEIVDKGLEQHLLSTIDKQAATIAASQKLDAERWKHLNKRVHYETYLFDTYEEGLGMLRGYIPQRIAFLNEAFAEPTWPHDGKTYLVRNATGLYLAETQTGVNQAALEEASLVTFEKTPMANVYGLKLPSGKYLASDNGWSTTLAETADGVMARFEVLNDPTTEGYVLLRNVGKEMANSTNAGISPSHLGVDESVVGAGVYTNKGSSNKYQYAGIDTKSKWMLTTTDDNGRVQITNLPTVYIDNENNLFPKDKENYVPVTVTVINNGTTTTYEARKDAGIRLRGNSTMNLAKKPFRLKLEKKANFLGLSANQKNWVFLANHVDRTLLRNSVAFEIGRQVELPYTTDCQLVDVVFNNEYLGSYLITDQMEVKKDRVNVEEQPTKDELQAGDNITGGYLLEVDGYANSEPVYFSTDRGLLVTIKYPKDDEIADSQKEYITNHVKEFEKRLFSDDFTDPEKGWRSMADTVSLVNWYIACELTANIDAFWSTYIHKRRDDDRLYFGPMWDYDIAFNNDRGLYDNINNVTPETDATRKPLRDYAHMCHYWVRRLWEDPGFRHAVNLRWKELTGKGLGTHLLNTLDHLTSDIDASQKLNFEKWPVFDKQVLGWEGKQYATYEENVAALRTFIENRINFLTDNFEANDWQLEAKPDANYVLANAQGTFLAETGGADGNVKQSYDETLADLKLVKVEGTPDFYAIQLPSGKYLGASPDNWFAQRYDSYTDNKMAQFIVERDIDGEHILVRNVGRELYVNTNLNPEQRKEGKKSRLGIDGAAEGGDIITDKNGRNERHKWNLHEVLHKADPFPVDPEKTYVIQNHYGLFIGDVATDVRQSERQDAAEVQFVAGDADGQWAIKLPTGKYLASNGDYNTNIADAYTGNNLAQFTLTQDRYSDHVLIKNVGMEAANGKLGAHLGIDNSGLNLKAYTNKNGLSDKHKWDIRPVPAEESTRYDGLEPGSQYYLQNAHGTYLAYQENTEGGRAVKQQDAADATKITLVATDYDNVFMLKLPNDTYVATDGGWKATVADTYEGSNKALFSIYKDPATGHARLRNLSMTLASDKGLAYANLGIDNAMPNAGIYTDKNGKSSHHLWDFHKPDNTGIGNAPYLYFDESNTDMSRLDAQTGEGTHTLLLHKKLTANQWGTIVLPVTLDANTVKATFGEQTMLSMLEGVDQNIPNRINFKSVDLSDANSKLEAGRLYIIKPIGTQNHMDNGTYRFDRVDKAKGTAHVCDINATDATPIYRIPGVTFKSMPSHSNGWSVLGDNVGTGGLTFKGTYVKQGDRVAKTEEIIPAGSFVVGASDGKWYHTTSPMYELKGFRGFLDTTASTATKIYFALDGIVDYETPTGIDGMMNDSVTSGPIYDLNGRKVSDDGNTRMLQKGFYIVNGKKIVVK